MTTEPPAFPGWCAQEFAHLFDALEKLSNAPEGTAECSSAAAELATAVQAAAAAAGNYIRVHTTEVQDAFAVIAHISRSLGDSDHANRLEQTSQAIEVMICDALNPKADHPDQLELIEIHGGDHDGQKLINASGAVGIVIVRPDSIGIAAHVDEQRIIKQLRAWLDKQPEPTA